MAYTSYAEKLKDPRWQKKRLEIMGRDNFTCQLCGAKDKTLNVHHWEYKHGADPWDADSGMLTTLCEDCHEEEMTLRPNNEAYLLVMLKHFHFSAREVAMVGDLAAFGQLRKIVDEYKKSKNG